MEQHGASRRIRIWFWCRPLPLGISPSAPCASASPLESALQPEAAVSSQGLAHCFEKDDSGKLRDVMVIEPLAANSLEAMMAGESTITAQHLIAPLRLRPIWICSL